MSRKILSLIICFCLLWEQAGFAQVIAQAGIPAYLDGLLTPDRFRPVHLRSLAFDPADDNLRIVLDKGDAKNISEAGFQDSTRQLLSYFLIGLTLPESSFWVNLRPDSPERMIDPALARTDIGRIMLEADLQLKKDIARYTSPKTAEGKQYWDSLYAKAEALFGAAAVTIPTMTRPWIVPNEIIVADSGTTACIYKATLKVSLESDHLKGQTQYAFDDNRLKLLNDYSSELIRALVLPRLTRDVNTSKRYAPLRQVYYSLILAQWFKSRLRSEGGYEAAPSGLASRVDSQNLEGLTSQQAWSKDTYFKAYQQSFAKGEYSEQEAVWGSFGQGFRRYFSGGIGLNTLSIFSIRAPAPGLRNTQQATVDFTGNPVQPQPVQPQPDQPQPDQPQAQPKLDGGKDPAPDKDDKPGDDISGTEVRRGHHWLSIADVVIEEEWGKTFFRPASQPDQSQRWEMSPADPLHILNAAKELLRQYPKRQDILEEVLLSFQEALPRFFVFDQGPEALYSLYSVQHGLIAFHSSVATDPIAVFYEAIKYLRARGAISEQKFQDLVEMFSDEYLILLGIGEDIMDELSQETIVESIRNITGNKELSGDDILPQRLISFIGQGSHKLVYKVTFKLRSGETVEVVIDINKRRDRSLANSQELNTLKKLRGKGVPRFGAMFITRDGRVGYLEEFISGYKLSDIKGALTTKIRSNVVSLLMSFSILLGGGMVPRDFHHSNFILRERDKEVVMVDVGDKRIFLSGKFATFEQRILFLGLLVAQYGYHFAKVPGKLNPAKKIFREEDLRQNHFIFDRVFEFEKSDPTKLTVSGSEIIGDVLWGLPDTSEFNVRLAAEVFLKEKERFFSALSARSPGQSERQQFEEFSELFLASLHSWAMARTSLDAGKQPENKDAGSLDGGKMSQDPGELPSYVGISIERDGPMFFMRPRQLNRRFEREQLFLKPPAFISAALDQLAVNYPAVSAELNELRLAVEGEPVGLFEFKRGAGGMYQYVSMDFGIAALHSRIANEPVAVALVLTKLMRGEGRISEQTYNTLLDTLIKPFVELSLLADDLSRRFDSAELAQIASLATDSRIAAEDLSGGFRIVRAGEGTHKDCYKVELERSSLFGGSVVFAAKKEKKTGDINGQEIQGLKKIKGRGAPRFAGTFESGDGRVIMFEEFIDGVEVKKLSQPLSTAQRRQIIDLLLSFSVDLGGGMVPRDFHGGNFMLTKKDEIFMVDIGEKRLYLAGRHGDIRHKILFLGLLMAYYGYHAGSPKDNFFIFEAVRNFSGKDKKGFEIDGSALLEEVDMAFKRHCKLNARKVAEIFWGEKERFIGALASVYKEDKAELLLERFAFDFMAGLEAYRDTYLPAVVAQPQERDKENRSFDGGERTAGILRIPENAYNALDKERLGQLARDIRAYKSDPGLKENVRSYLSFLSALKRRIDVHMLDINFEDQSRGSIAYNPAGGLDVFLFGIDPAITDLLVVDTMPFGSGEQLYRLNNAQALKRYYEIGADAGEALEYLGRQSSVGNIVLERIILGLGGDISRVSYFRFGADGAPEFWQGESKDINHYQNAVVEFFDRGAQKNRRFWYIRHDLNTEDANFSRFIEVVRFHTLIVKAAFDLFDPDSEAFDLKQAEQKILRPARENDALVITDESLNGRRVAYPMWAVQPYSLDLEQGERFGVSQDKVFFGPASFLLVPENQPFPLLDPRQMKEAGYSVSLAVNSLIEAEGDRGYRYLPTDELNDALLGYDSGLRPARPVNHIPVSLDEIEEVQVRLPSPEVFLVSKWHGGSVGIVRLGFLEDGRPVALKGYHSPDESYQEDPYLAGFQNQWLWEDFQGAYLADRLGIGPQFHGKYVDAQERVNLVMDIVPGDFPNVRQEWIRAVTFSDMLTIRQRLDGYNAGAGKDFQFHLTPQGRVEVIDPAEIYAVSETRPRSLEGYWYKLAMLLDDATAKVEQEALDYLAVNRPQILFELQEYLQEAEPHYFSDVQWELDKSIKQHKLVKDSGALQPDKGLPTVDSLSPGALDPFSEKRSGKDGGAFLLPVQPILQAFGLAKIPLPQKPVWEQDGYTAYRVSAAALGGDAERSGLLARELYKEDSAELAAFDLVYNGQGDMIAVFPVLSETALRFLNTQKTISYSTLPMYLNLSYYYHRLPGVADKDALQQWEKIVDQLNKDRSAIQQYKQQAGNLFLTEVNEKQSPFFYVEFSLEPGRTKHYAESLLHIREGKITLDTAYLNRPASTGLHRAILPVFPTVYSPAENYLIDREYYRSLINDFDLRPGHEALVVGPGAGIEVWIAALRTGKPVHAIGINPLEIANLRWTAQSAGFEVIAQVNDNIISARGVPHFRHVEFDRLIWNMPAYRPVRDMAGREVPLEQQVKTRGKEHWDGDLGAATLIRFASGLPVVLADDGEAILWNQLGRNNVETRQSRRDKVKSILEQAGAMSIVESPKIASRIEPVFDVKVVASYDSNTYFVRRHQAKKPEDKDGGTEKVAGIDFRSMPIRAVAAGAVPAWLNQKDAQPVDGAEELKKIEESVAQGAQVPANRLAGYIRSCSKDGAISCDPGRVLTCVAELLRQEEDHNRPTDPILTDILLLLSSPS